jgi:hypothetical protein
MEIPGKGQIEMIEIVNPVENSRTSNDATSDHVPENSGT